MIRAAELELGLKVDDVSLVVVVEEQPEPISDLATARDAASHVRQLGDVVEAVMMAEMMVKLMARSRTTTVEPKAAVTGRSGAGDH